MVISTLVCVESESSREAEKEWRKRGGGWGTAIEIPSDQLPFAPLADVQLIIHVTEIAASRKSRREGKKGVTAV